jgi:hypothetical protein
MVSDSEQMPRAIITLRLPLLIFRPWKTKKMNLGATTKSITILTINKTAISN